MFTDSTGYMPEWLMVGISCVAILAGITLAIVIFPASGFLSTVLLSAGAMSLISGSMYGDGDGFSEAAWKAGLITGAAFGAFLFGGGSLRALTSLTDGFASFGLTALGLAVSGSAGVGSGYLREYLYSSYSGNPYNRSRANQSALIFGAVALLAYFPTMISRAIAKGYVSSALGSWSSLGVGAFQAGILVAGEVIIDFGGYIIENIKTLPSPRFV